MSLVSQEEFVLHCSEVSTLHGPAERHSEEFKMSEKRLWLARIKVAGKYDHVHVAASVPCLENTKTTAHRIKHNLVSPARMYSEEYTAQLGTVKCFPPECCGVAPPFIVECPDLLAGPRGSYAPQDCMAWSHQEVLARSGTA